MKITNDESLNRLEVSVEGGLGILRYQIARDTMWLLHVQVPPEAQGQGAGDGARLESGACLFLRGRVYPAAPRVSTHASVAVWGPNASFKLIAAWLFQFPVQHPE
jgi:hypothetical protein